MAVVRWLRQLAERAAITSDLTEMLALACQHKRPFQFGIDLDGNGVHLGQYLQGIGITQCSCTVAVRQPECPGDPADARQG